MQQGYDSETGAGTFNPDSFLRAVGPEPYNVCNVEISRRPTDGRYGENPNRLQQFHQFQVIMKPSPANIQALYLESLEAIGLKLKNHDIRFVHDDWESPTQGAWGLGWEVWCDGMEVTQFTYFQNVGGINLKPVAVELAYGIERIAMFLQGVDNIYNVKYNQVLNYGDIFLEREKEFSTYNFETADVSMWQSFFQSYENEAKKLLGKGLPIPAYDFAVKASHAFNMLDARGAVSQSARVDYMHRVKSLCCRAAEIYLETRKNLDFPLFDKTTSLPATAAPIPRIPAKRFSKNDTFLLEIGSEELPATFVEPAMKSLKELLAKLFEKLELAYENIEVYGTPRRLAAIVENLAATTPGGSVTRKGPKCSVAFDAHGKLTKQGSGFFSANGLPEIDLSDLKAGKHPRLTIENDYLMIETRKKQKSTLSLLAEHLPSVVESISFKKRMHWSNFDTLYARPLRWIVSLYGKYVVPFAIADIVSSDTTYGHSQMCPKPVAIGHPNRYLNRLKKHKVLVCQKERLAFIREQLAKIAKKENADVVDEEKVTREVLYLSEYPTLASHHFNDRFLTLPDELLSSEMIDHQRYYPLKNKHGAMINTFVVAVDKKPTQTILKNNRAVLEARLSDGFFLYQQDMKDSLLQLNEKLKEIVFHEKLGSLYDKVERVKKYAQKLAQTIPTPYLKSAAEFCKADISSAVVGEFPELQGIIGKYYALKQGESDEVAEAIEEHWWPLNDDSPTATTDGGALLAIADKCDTLSSYMGIGITASSSKDPYGLRRAARGIIRTLIDKKWALDLNLIIDSPEIISFIMQRLPAVLSDYNFSKEEISLCQIPGASDPYDIFCRVSALHSFRKTSSRFDHFYEIYKRAKGQVEKENLYEIQAKLLKEKEELSLYEKLEEITPLLKEEMARRNYLSAFQSLSSLNKTLDHFFEEVHVQTEDEKVRQNRIALLQRVFDLTRSLVDFSRHGTKT